MEPIDLKKIHNVYFIGIGGIGMSALARYFRVLNKRVGGYDKTVTPLTEELEAQGIAVHFKDDPQLIPPAFLEPSSTLVVYTPAVPSDQKELNHFREKGFNVAKRSEVLGQVTRDTFCFAVAGTHGKTTTSCILAHLLNETGTPLTAFLGGISEDFNSNFLYTGSEVSVVEADEFDRSFLRLSPDIACITSMDADHLDIYGDRAELVRSFGDFAERVSPKGALFVRNGLPLKGLTYGIEDDSDYCIRNIRIEQGSYIFDLITPEISLEGVRFGKPGRHNLLNGLVAFAMAMRMGSSPSRIAEALPHFKGVERRFSYKIRNEDFVFIDDYAHHPTEINAVFEAISEMHPMKKVLAVFQPHLYSRTRDFANEFAESLSQFDSVLLLDIYPAREKPMEGIDSEWLLGKIKNKNKKRIQKSDLLHEIREQHPEVLVTMGAGDIGLEITNLKRELQHAY